MSQPPILDYSPAPLTRLQRKALLGYAGFHTKPPTLVRLLLRSWLAHVLLLGWGIGGSVALFYLGVPNGAFLVLGIMAGAYLRDVRTFLVFLRLWPVLDRVLDWNRVRELVGVPADERPTPEKPAG